MVTSKFILSNFLPFFSFVPPLLHSSPILSFSDPWYRPHSYLALGTFDIEQASAIRLRATFLGTTPHSQPQLLTFDEPERLGAIIADDFTPSRWARKMPLSSHDGLTSTLDVQILENDLPSI